MGLHSHNYVLEPCSLFVISNSAGYSYIIKGRKKDKKVAVSKFTRTMGTLTSSGVPILEGLDITAKTAGNRVIELAVMDVKAAVSEGKTLAEPLAKSKVFPDMVTHMIAGRKKPGRELANRIERLLGVGARLWDQT